MDLPGLLSKCFFCSECYQYTNVFPSNRIYRIEFVILYSISDYLKWLIKKYNRVLKLKYGFGENYSLSDCYFVK